MAELKVEIGADITDLKSKLTQTQNELNKTAKISEQAGKRIGAVGASAAGGIDKLGKSTANATPAVQEFSRVIQDAPFGIMGVGNNIQQLVANFGNLSKSAGGSGAAIKAMVSSLAGPAGLLLAVSAVTSLLTVYGDELLALVGKSNKLADATSKYLGEAEAEGIVLQNLVAIARDENQSKKVRQGAIDEINKKYGDYLGNLDLESIKTQNVTDKINALTSSFIRQAKIKGLQELITEEQKGVSEDLIDLEFEREEAVKNVTKAQDALNKAIERNDTKQAIARFNANLNNSKRALNDIDNEIKNIEADSADALKPIETQLKKIMTQDFAAGTNQASVQAAKKAAEDKIKAEEAARKDAEKVYKAKLKSDEDYAKKRAKLLADIDADIFKEDLENALKAPDLSGTGLKPIEIDIQPFLGNEAFKEIEAFEARMESLKDNVGIFNSAIGASFGVLSNQLAEKLSTGNEVLDAFTGSLIKSLTDIATAQIQSLILEKVIATGKKSIDFGLAQSNAIVIGTSAAAALGPAGLPALPATIAASQGIVAGAFGSIAAFATGTPSYSGDNNLAYVNRNEMILQPNQSATLFNALRSGGLSNMSASNNGNSWDGEISGSIALRGQNQIVQLARADRKNKRFFA